MKKLWVFLIVVLSVQCIAGEYSLYFDGNGDYVEIPDVDELSPSSFTIEFWVKQPELVSGRNFYVFKPNPSNNHNEYVFAQNSPTYGGLYMYVNYGLFTTSIAPASDQWAHLAAVFDSDLNNMEIFVDGSSIGTYSTTEEVPNSTGNLFIGWGPSQPDYNALTGTIDELRISNIARYTNDFTPSRVKFTTDTYTVALYHFNEGSGNTLTDYSGNDNHGTIYGATWSTDTPINDGLIAYYPFNGNANDESGNGNNGIVYGATLTTDKFGNENSAFNFDGIDDYIEVSDNSTLDLTNFSIVLWTKIEPSDSIFHSNKHIIWINKGGWGLDSPGMNANYSISVVDSNYQVGFEDNNGEDNVIWDNSDILPNWWFNIAITFDGNILKSYIDGIEIDSLITNTLPETNNLPLRIGLNATPGYFQDEFFKGIIDDIRIYNRALTDDEIDSLFHLNGWDITDNIDLWIDSLTYDDNTTVSVPINVSFPANKQYDSAELSVKYDNNNLIYEGIDTSNSLTGTTSWNYTTNQLNDSLVISWFAGSSEITGDGVLFNLKFVLVGNPCTFCPITITDAVFNTGSETVNIENGGVYISPVPDYGDVDENGIIQAHDAALILKHLIETDTLYCQGLANADVTEDGTVSALDASVILQYGVGLINDLPYDTSVNGRLVATGEFSMQEELGTLGGTFDLPIWIKKGSNIYSFEGLLEYDQGLLIFSDLKVPSDKSHFDIQYNNSDGIIRFVGAGTQPDGTDGIFITACFSYNPLATYSNTKVCLSKIRINEEIENTDVGETIIYNLVGLTNQNAIPTEFSLKQNHPNPFNPTTVIEYALPKTSDVQITIFDVNGRIVQQLVNRKQQAGYYTVEWDASRYSSGVYFYQIQAGEFHQVKKCLLVK